MSYCHPSINYPRAYFPTRHLTWTPSFELRTHPLIFILSYKGLTTQVLVDGPNPPTLLVLGQARNVREIQHGTPTAANSSTTSRFSGGQGAMMRSFQAMREDPRSIYRKTYRRGGVFDEPMPSSTERWSHDKEASDWNANDISASVSEENEPNRSVMNDEGSTEEIVTTLVPIETGWYLLGIVVVLSFNLQVISGVAPQKQGRYPSSSENDEDDNGKGKTNGRRITKTSEMDDMDDNVCSTGESYVLIDSATSCCNHTIVLNHGLDFSKFWKECAVGLRSPKSKAEITNENFVNASRRVYACILSKYLRKQTTNLLGFATIMTTNYPTSIKNAILKLAKVQSNAEKPLANYNELRNIRTAYMDIQKQVCASMDTANNDGRSNVFNKTSKTNSPSTCDQSEEVELNGGTCCQGQSVPLDLDFWHP
ncbi:unnamed protein product, partial [Allacma fusca]